MLTVEIISIPAIYLVLATILCLIKDVRNKMFKNSVIVLMGCFLVFAIATYLLGIKLGLFWGDALLIANMGGVVGIMLLIVMVYISIWAEGKWFNYKYVRCYRKNNKRASNKEQNENKC